MRIVADANIPFVEEFFGRFGAVRRVPGRLIGPADLRDADVLLVRSVTRVDRQLLQSSPVRFVGTATIGEEHVDRAWLAAQRIGFASAPGCNARSVAEYVTAAVLALALRYDWDLGRLRAGIIGRGNVGGRVEAQLRTLGISCVACDPPLAAAGQQGLVSQEACLACDIVTVHTPLTRQGRWPTWHMLDAAALARLAPGALLINTSRGAVIEPDALVRLLRRGHTHAVLDVWAGEPAIDAQLVELTDMATAHVAGYSLDGKIAGTRMVYEALCQYLEHPADNGPVERLPGRCPDACAVPAGCSATEMVHGVVRAAYDIAADDARLRQVCGSGEIAAGFDRLRAEYPVRREFPCYDVQTAAAPEPVRRCLVGLGFRLV